MVHFMAPWLRNPLVLKARSLSLPSFSAVLSVSRWKVTKGFSSTGPMELALSIRQEKSSWMSVK
jgi:hypothetical protein